MRKRWKSVFATTVLVTLGQAATLGTAEATGPPGVFQQLAHRYLSERASLLTASAPKASEAFAGSYVASSLKEDLEADAEGLARHRQKLASKGLTYAHIDVNVTVEEIDESTSSRAEVKLTELSRLYYTEAYHKLHPDAPKFWAYELPHVMSFSSDGSIWKIASADAQITGLAPSTQVTEESAEPVPPQEVYPAEDFVPPEASIIKPAIMDIGGVPIEDASYHGYDRWKIVDYANRYWKYYNDYYRTYDNDCTNFISQAMHAAGWTMVGSEYGRADTRRWNYGYYSWTTSYTWAGAHNWWWYAHRSGRTSSRDNVWKMWQGDVLQLDYGRDRHLDHSMIVVSRSPGNSQTYATELYLNYHSVNTYKRPLTEILVQRPSDYYYVRDT